MPIKIGLLGFGRTGSIVAKEIVSDPLLSLEWVCRKNISKDFLFASHALGYDKKFSPFIAFDKMNGTFLRKNPVDIVIDFSSSSAAKIYRFISEEGIRIVSAISNYDEESYKLIKLASKKTAVLHSPNITVGINWLILASKLLQKIIPNADIEIIEQHFRDKKDASGTALRLAGHLNLDPNKNVNSIRVGGIVGKHEVIFGLPNQTIHLKHESINRAAFGTGAIFASKWLADKKTGLYSMEQVFHDKFLKKIKELEL
ncbi:MAG: dihydrodipicolinate reductase C-terminal domain-containing protein [Bacteriovorax sp.]|jgi:4-hydroxy-tetrahydrodipicolinate reductase